MRQCHLNLGGKFWAQKGRGMGAGEARPLCFSQWSHPSSLELDPGRSSSEGEEVDLGGGKRVQAVRGAEKGQLGLQRVSKASQIHWGTYQSTGRSIQAEMGKGAAWRAEAR